MADITISATFSVNPPNYNAHRLTNSTVSFFAAKACNVTFPTNPGPFTDNSVLSLADNDTKSRTLGSSNGTFNCSVAAAEQGYPPIPEDDDFTITVGN